MSVRFSKLCSSNFLTSNQPLNILICVFVILVLTSTKKEDKDQNLRIRTQSLKKQTKDLRNIEELFTAKRFDLPMKYIYANYRERNINSDFGLRLGFGPSKG